ncbi:MFS transporter [Verminephrobacter aporrectodeae]|uniref:MFS transporter n=1 Tax=Verminephrobacter aporrectodeae TaxID=1110389 RepID=UPI002244E133|nr:MFS transporter [Verminephrobacter aporrectodeae]MCW8174360.1 MFS transporter [Verminephrobacter aporrectodeae subsp. tuberculatae]MCW8202095.1 MFS transporter [Verminephrobacter aporrectodeae subsp. tuberculatae]
MNERRHAMPLAFALCVITAGVNLQAPLYATYARIDGVGVMATTIAFSFYVAGVLPILLALGGLSDRIGRRRVMLIALPLSASGTGLMLAYPHIPALALARFVLGAGTALMSATATAYMMELIGSEDTSGAANWVTASTSIGFGLGPALTSACLMFQETVHPPSFPLHLAATALAVCLVWRLPETASRRAGAPASMLRLPCFTRKGLWYGSAILLCWATTGLVISILPSALATHGLSMYSGLSTMLAISCGLLFQPMARKLEPGRSTRIGLLILLPAYAMLAWGAWSGTLVAVLAGSLLASSACYGFVYLGGLAGTAKAAAAPERTRASAAYFLMAYIGFSVPVVFTGLIADHYGMPIALLAFGILLLAGTAMLLPTWKRPAKC